MRLSTSSFYSIVIRWSSNDQDIISGYASYAHSSYAHFLEGTRRHCGKRGKGERPAHVSLHYTARPLDKNTSRLDGVDVPPNPLSMATGLQRTWATAEWRTSVPPRPVRSGTRCWLLRSRGCWPARWRSTTSGRPSSLRSTTGTPLQSTTSTEVHASLVLPTPASYHSMQTTRVWVLYRGVHSNQD